MATETRQSLDRSSNRPVAHDPAVLSRPQYPWLWLALRGYVGMTWLIAGAQKLVDPAWTTTGDALKQAWAPAVSGGPLQVMLDPQSVAWAGIGRLIGLGETLLGLAVLLGVLTGAAAFAGSVLQACLYGAGVAGVDVLLFPAVLALMLGWKVAGYYGLDRLVLTKLGVGVLTPARDARLPEGAAIRAALSGVVFRPRAQDSQGRERAA